MRQDVGCSHFPQRCAASVTSLIHGRPVCQQREDNGEVALRRSLGQGGATIGRSVGQGGVRPGCQQRLDNGEMSAEQPR